MRKYPAAIATDYGGESERLEELEAAHPNAVRSISILPEPTQTSPCTIIEAKLKNGSYSFDVLKLLQEIRLSLRKRQKQPQ